jgi:hypothetical protein
MKRKKIDKLATKLSKNTPGSVDYLRNYNKARSKIERKLTATERQRYKAMAKEWSERRPPPQIQQRYAHGNGSDR